MGRGREEERRGRGAREEREGGREGGEGREEGRVVGVRTLEQSWEGKEGRRAEDRKHHSSLVEELMSSDPS